MKTFWEYINKFEEASEPQIAAQPTTSSSPVADVSNIPAPTMGSVPQPEVQGYHPKLKPWKAKKSEIVRFWKALAQTFLYNLNLSIVFIKEARYKKIH